MAGDDSSLHARRALRAYQALGHCDIYPQGDSIHVRAAPPLLARLPFLGFPQAVLCGARGPELDSLLQALREYNPRDLHVEITSQDTFSPCIPRRICIAASDESLLSGAASHLGIPYASAPPAWAFLTHSPSLQEYLAAQEFIPGTGLDWARRDFNLHRFQFRRDYRDDGATHLSAYKHPHKSLEYYFLVQSSSRRPVDRFWGIYAYLALLHLNVLFYDARTLLFAAPALAPLPGLFARALALCSGYAPLYVQRHCVAGPFQGGGGFDVYPAVPPVYAQRIAAKLDQSLVPATISLPEHRT
jgi:hypothetical protein